MLLLIIDPIRERSWRSNRNVTGASDNMGAAGRIKGKPRGRFKMCRASSKQVGTERKIGRRVKEARG